MMQNAQYTRPVTAGVQGAPVGATAAPNTGMAPHPIVQQGPTMPAPGRPVMGVNKGEVGVPWNFRFAR